MLASLTVSRESHLDHDWHLLATLLFAFSTAGSEVLQFDRMSEAATPCYFEWRDIYPELSVLIKNLDMIKEEAGVAMQQDWVPWPEDHVGWAPHSDKMKRDWTVFPFLHTFPALDASKSRWIGSTIEMCPRTSTLLRTLPNVRTALFSRLGPSTRLAPHTGWSDLANYVLRCHLCLHMDNVPADNIEMMMDDEGNLPRELEGNLRGEKGTCGMWVDGEVQYHSPGKIIVFDDSKRHKAFNYSIKERVVLIVDLLRPMSVAHGTAKGGHTPELNVIIDHFK